MSEDNLTTCFIIFLIVIYTIVVCFLGFKINTLEQDAIKLGYAEYNSVTGDWQWKGKHERSN